MNLKWESLHGYVASFVTMTLFYLQFLFLNIYLILDFNYSRITLTVITWKYKDMNKEIDHSKRLLSKKFSSDLSNIAMQIMVSVLTPLP